MGDKFSTLQDINEESQLRFLQYMKLAVSLREQGWQLRDRFEQVDRAYQMENDFTEEQKKSQRANRVGNAAKLQNAKNPTVMEATELSVAFLSNVFLMDYPMFKFGTDPQAQDLALMWNTLVGEDQTYYGWPGQLNMAFRNGSKYNFAPIEVEWKSVINTKPANGTGTRGVTLETVTYEGNCITALDPYNTFYDARVPIYKCHIEGEFVGYLKHMTRIGVKRFITSLGESRIKNDKKAFESADWEVQYYYPLINPNVTLENRNWANGDMNWDAWAKDEAKKHIAYKNMYTVCVCYARIMPYEFNIRAARDQTPDIWKLVAVNGVMVYAQPVPNAHDFLPIIIAQPSVDNLDHQTKSEGEYQINYQEMIAALWNAKLASARRRTTDRMLYNPLLIDPDHINSPNPSAKIPVRPSAYGRKLEEAVYPFPFHDENSQYWLQEAQGIKQMSMEAAGRNKVSTGQFQKGNKLQDEFNTVMANAGARERTQAIMWETFAFHPIKQILKSNYAQFSPKGEKYNRKTGQQVTIDPVALRKTVSDFEVGDGLLPIQRLVHSDVMNTAFQYLGSNPAIGQEFELGPMFSYLMKVQGVDKLEQFHKSPEQMNYERALGVYQSLATELIKQGKTPDEIKQIAGEMPQPPKPATKPGAQPNANPTT